MNAELSLLIERHEAEWFRAQAAVPGVELHDDPDVVWLVHPGSAWGNAGTHVRFASETAGKRLDALVARYRTGARGMGLWVSPSATPADLPALLSKRGLRLRKRFPAMLRKLDRSRRPSSMAPSVEVRLVEDVSLFLEVAHPTIGAVTTERRRFGWRSLATYVSERPQRSFPFVAWLGDRPVGASLLFMGSECAGLHDLTVIEVHRGKGIGTALLERTCQEAAARGASSMALLATSDGERVYARNGFTEIDRFAYWYRGFDRLARMLRR